MTNSKSVSEYKFGSPLISSFFPIVIGYPILFTWGFLFKFELLINIFFSLLLLFSHFIFSSVEKSNNGPKIFIKHLFFGILILQGYNDGSLLIYELFKLLKQLIKLLFLQQLLKKIMQKNLISRD